MFICEVCEKVCEEVCNKVCDKGAMKGATKCSFTSHVINFIQVSEEMVTLRNKLSDSEKICLSLIEKSKDKDLKLELLKSEVHLIANPFRSIFL